MTPESWTEDPLSSRERAEFEEDLVAFCDRELDLLGGIEGLDVLYAGGTSPLWIEGLVNRLGENGSLTVLDLDAEALEKAAELFETDPELPLRPRFVVGDVFDLPFESDSFDLAYSSGLFHELDSRRGSASGALSELARVVRPGGSVATSDFVNDLPAAQLEEEAIEAEVARLIDGERRLGISTFDTLARIHGDTLTAVEFTFFEPFGIRHLDKLTLSRKEPPGFERLTGADRERLNRRWTNLLERVRREGYTRPATLFARGKASLRYFGDM